MIIDRIDSRFPGLREKIETMDVSTPPTAERFKGNRFGWQAGPLKNNAAKIMRKGLSKTLPGLDNFNMVSQWAFATIGVSTVALLGRNFVKDLCKKDKKTFVAQ
jgi:phytoene dehydrogenase-like protein